MNKSPEERRAHFRLCRNFILTYQVKGNHLFGWETCQVNNISKGGVNFSSAKPLKPGDNLFIEVKAPFITDSLKLEGVVLNCRTKIADMIYEIRVQYNQVSPEVLVMLDKIEKYGKP